MAHNKVQFGGASIKKRLASFETNCIMALNLPTICDCHTDLEECLNVANNIAIPGIIAKVVIPTSVKWCGNEIRCFINLELYGAVTKVITRPELFTQ